MWVCQHGVTEAWTEKKCGAEADLQICTLPVSEQTGNVKGTAEEQNEGSSVCQTVTVQHFIMFPSTYTLGQSCLSLSCVQLLDSAEFPELTEQKAEPSAVLLRILMLSLCRLVSSFTSTFPARPSPPSRSRPLTALAMTACVSDVLSGKLSNAAITSTLKPCRNIFPCLFQHGM